MEAADISSYISTLVLTVIALLGLKKDWKDYGNVARWVTVIAVLAAGLTGAVTTFYSGRSATENKQQILTLTQ